SKAFSILSRDHPCTGSMIRCISKALLETFETSRLRSTAASRRRALNRLVSWNATDSKRSWGEGLEASPGGHARGSHPRRRLAGGPGERLGSGRGRRVWGASQPVGAGNWVSRGGHRSSRQHQSHFGQLVAFFPPLHDPLVFFFSAMERTNSTRR